MPYSISRFGFVVVIATLCFAPASRGQPIDAPVDIGAQLGAIVTKTKIPGMAAVVLKGDQIVAQGAAGFRKSGNPDRVTINDQFLLCSAGKAMTATLAAMTIEDGKLKRSSTLSEIFPEMAHMDPGWKVATVGQLLEHRAGAPSDLDRFWTMLRLVYSRGTPAEKRRSIVAKILSQPPEYPPGSRYIYSSLDYFIICEILEKQDGEPTEAMIRSRLWKPLGITDAGFGAPGSQGTIEQPWGHWGMVFAGHPVEPGRFVAQLTMPLFYGPVGAIHMSVIDWSHFISLNLRGDPENPHRNAILISASSFADLHESHQGTFYESGWILLTKDWANGHRAGDTGRVISSQGDNGFWHCEAWVAPEIDFAVVVVCNQGGPTPDKAASIACKESLDEQIQEFATTKVR
jgi:CubicO group peptidase (beta-lactamase class C family)